MSGTNSTVAAPTPQEIQALLDTVQNTFGVIMIGSTASVGLLGVTTLQGWIYYNNFPTDPLITKVMVAIVWIIEFLRSTFTVHAAYHYLVLNWGNVLALASITWSLSIITFMTNLGELFGHLYFAWRISVLAKTTRARWVLTGIVVFLTLWNFSMGLSVYVVTLRSSTIASFSSGVTVILTPFALATAISTDVSIMVCLLFLLNRGRTGFSKSNRLINTLMVYAIQIGMVTVVADTAILIMSQLTGNIGFTYLGVYAIVGNLYANSLLASLNARSSLRAAEMKTDFQGVSTFRFQSGPATGTLDSTMQERSMNAAQENHGQTYHLPTLQSASRPAGDEDVKNPPVFRIGPEDSFDGA